MSRLIRMDPTGHTTLAEWTAEDAGAVDAPSAPSASELDRATTRWSPRARATPSRCASCRSTPSW